MSTDAYIFDAIRTPRGKGRKNGALAGVPPIQLLTLLLKELEQRHRLDTSQVDDIVLGCVTPVAVLSRCRVLQWAQTAVH